MPPPHGVPSRARLTDDRGMSGRVRCPTVTPVSPRKARRLPAEIPRKPRGGLARGRTAQAGGETDSEGPALRLGPERIESAPDGECMVRATPGAAAGKTYRCPGCDQEIRPDTAHVVVWPAYTPGLAERRHWHSPCWKGRLDRHLIRKASYRLPALADLAVLRFNTRGTASEQGRSEGEFGGGDAERDDVAAAIAWCTAAGLPRLWLLGWSFGTELALRWGNAPAVEGAILLSPPLIRACDADLDAWAASGKPMLVMVPELDDYLRPGPARERFARVPQAELVAVERAKHLWLGEPSVRIVLGEIVRRVNPEAWPLPTEWKD